MSSFDRLARCYELAMPATDPAPLLAGLAAARRPIRDLVDLGGGPGRGALALRRSAAGDADGAGVGSAGDAVVRSAVDAGDRDAGGAGDAIERSVVVDAAPGMCRRARANDLEAVCGDAGRLPLGDATVDAVLLVDALHHLPDARTAFGEIARVLRPGGVAVIREFDPETWRGRGLVAAERVLGFDSTFRRPGGTADLLALAGLETRRLDEGFTYTVAGVSPGPASGDGDREAEPGEA